MKIQGINLSETEVLAPQCLERALASHNPTSEENEILRELDRRFSALKNVKVPGLSIDSSGKVDFSKGYYLHGIPVGVSAQQIESRQKYGILTSEHFGVLESARECRLCVSVTQTSDLAKHSDVKKRYYKDSEGFDIESSIVPKIGFIIDNSIVTRPYENRQLDFFSYVKNPDKYREVLTEEEIKILEFIRSFSPKCETVVTGMFASSYDDFNWRAIVGGIPANFVVGICINKKYIEHQDSRDPNAYENALRSAKLCADIFGVPLVDENAKVIYKPKTATKTPKEAV